VTDAEKLAKAAEILNDMQVDGWEKYHVVGCFERRVTIYSQQVRALNLIWALSLRGNITSESKIAVIGGGIAGLTAAAAARHLGWNVTVLEKDIAFLRMQDGATHRPIHPFIYDWPNEGSLEKNAGLPLLNWEAANADEVVKQMAEGWRPFDEPDKDFVQITDLKMSRDGTLTWNSSTFNTERFSHVIVAVGFGREKFEKLQLKRYWTSENLSQAGQHGEPTKFLISGCGDGGVIDVLRIRLDQFNLVNLISKLRRADGYADLCTEMNDIENTVPWTTGEDGVAQHYYNRYRKLKVSSAISDLIKFKPLTKVVLCYKNAGPYSPRASTLNRFLLSRVLSSKQGDVRVVPVELKESMIAPNGKRFDVKFDESSDDAETFDDVILRHGPVSAMSKLTPDFFKAAKPVNPHQRIARTPAKSWPEGFFGPEPAPIKKPGHSEPPKPPELPELTRESQALYRALLVVGDDPLPAALLECVPQERDELIEQSLLQADHSHVLRLVPYFASLARNQLKTRDEMELAVENACGLLWSVYSDKQIDFGELAARFPNTPSRQLERYRGQCVSHVMAIGKKSLDTAKPELAKFVTKFLHIAGNRMVSHDSSRALEVLQYANRLASDHKLTDRRLRIGYDIAEARYEIFGKKEEVRQAWIAVVKDFGASKLRPNTPWFLANAYQRIAQIEHALGHNGDASRSARSALQHAQEALAADHDDTWDMPYLFSDLKELFDKLGDRDNSSIVTQLLANIR